MRTSLGEVIPNLRECAVVPPLCDQEPDDDIGFASTAAVSTVDKMSNPFAADQFNMEETSVASVGSSYLRV
eukprot:6455504-Pyramimonas_sp.AAC.1